MKYFFKKLIYTYLKKDSHYFSKKKIFKDKDHRAYIGGRWEEIGNLQFNFLKKMGLLPHHSLIDVGCGSLRGGVHFIEYLDKFNYFGTEINNTLVEIGIQEELTKEQKNKITKKNFLISDNFNLDFDLDFFDYGIAVSVFTHLKKKNIINCLQSLNKKFKSGCFYATFFIVEEKDKNYPCEQLDGFTSFPFKDPFHYTLEEIYEMARKSSFKCNLINEFHHPRNQKMIEFKKLTQD